MGISIPAAGRRGWHQGPGGLRGPGFLRWGSGPQSIEDIRHKKSCEFRSSFCASGGNRTRTAVSGQGIFVPLWLSPPSVCGLDYSFTMGRPGPLGVSCLVSAPSSYQRLGSRLPSALPVKVSLNLRHSTSLFSERALNCAFPR